LWEWNGTKEQKSVSAENLSVRKASIGFHV